jgi:hypothetical protein
MRRRILGGGDPDNKLEKDKTVADYVSSHAKLVLYLLVWGLVSVFVWCCKLIRRLKVVGN